MPCEIESQMAFRGALEFEQEETKETEGGPVAICSSFACRFGFTLKRQNVFVGGHVDRSICKHG